MSTRPSLTQIEALVEFLEQNPGIAKGLLRTTQAKLETKRKWANLALTLNALGGANKDGQGWAKYWAEKKCALKKQCAQLSASMRSTGGGVATNLPILSALDNRLVAVMGGQEFATRDESISVNPFPNQTRPISPILSSSIVNIDSVEDIIVCPAIPSTSQTIIPPAITPPHHSTQPSIHSVPPPYHSISPHQSTEPPHHSTPPPHRPTPPPPPSHRPDQIKYLGICIDNFLSWKNHIASLTARVRKIIFVFKKLRHSAEPNILYLVYYSLCQSILTYCIPVWGGAAESHLIHLERAQRAVLKVMTFKRFRYPTSQLYEECKVLSVRQLFVLGTICRKHASLQYVTDIPKKRRAYKVCQAHTFRSSLAARHCGIIGCHLYNLANKHCNIYPLSRFQCKKTVTDWLMTKSYDETENLLKITIL